VSAHERAVERGCEAMQVFNQSPRMSRSFVAGLIR
jgi:hypothetical protein